MRIQTIGIPDDVMAVLQGSTVTGNTLQLPFGQLERSLYAKTDKCLSALGGKWDRRAKGHVFSMDPSVALENAIATGKIVDEKKTFQFFPTPVDVADRMVELAAQFRSVIDEHGESIKLPAGAFKESDTGVSTRLVRLVKS